MRPLNRPSCDNTRTVGPAQVKGLTDGRPCEAHGWNGSMLSKKGVEEPSEQ
jgi:hypothetical protein